MYAVKGSWAGQTFALATASDSAGKKSRVRRSKEERKSMVETYIKRYQTSNNGSFPSLNLTHKEVGGSFYTVREIVREIIQENRVLGPARLSPELQHADDVAIQYPLGSISSEPQAPFFHLGNEQNNVINHHEKRELTLDNEKHLIKNQTVESFQCINEDETDEIGKDLDNQACSKSATKDVIFSNLEDSGSSDISLNSSGKYHDENGTNLGGVLDDNQINGLFAETDKLQVTGPLTPRSLETDEVLTLIEESKVYASLPTDEVVVETFPLKQENNGTDDLCSLSTEFGNSNGNFNDSEVKPVDLNDNLNDISYRGKISSSVESTDNMTANGTNGSQMSVSGRCPDSESNHTQENGAVAQHTEHILIYEAFDFSESPEKKINTSERHDCMDQVSLHSSATSMTAEQLDCQVKTAPKGTACLEDRSQKSNDNNRQDEKAVAAKFPPVDRINLQSWESTARKRQPNPLLAIIKSFADALIKFWS